MRRLLIVAVAVAFACAGAMTAQTLPTVSHGMDLVRLGRIRAVVEEAIQAKQLPGAVVLVGRGHQVVYHQAFGNRALVPSVEPMTRDTIFDLASLTKVVATTTAVMLLVEDGRIRLNDRVSAYIPGFARAGKGDITVRHLLTHVSGLRPDLDLDAEFDGYDAAIARAIDETPLAPPGDRFVYSDINFFLLGDIVARVAGLPLDRFAADRVFKPLGMRDTMFKPPRARAARIAPTEPCAPLAWPCTAGPDRMLRGVVHDPTARRMHGVAGHAGLFSTAVDLSLFCRTFLNGGRLNGARLLSPLTMATMVSPATPGHLGDIRGLGWDIDSSYSGNRGDLLPLGSFGHTGFTGTSIWIDPATEVFVVFLSNRVHPDGKGDVTPLRGKVATIVAAAITDPEPHPRLSNLSTLRSAATEFWSARARAGAVGDRRPATASPADVMTGIDVLASEGFARLKGKRVGLLTNHTGRTRSGQSTIDALHAAPGVQLKALFTPEHGIRGNLDAPIPSGKDERTGLPVYSLYGENAMRRPSPESLADLDVVVVDLQDIGARFYTYTSSMAYVLEGAATQGVEVMILDRPNPLSGDQVEGPMLDAGLTSFIGYFPMPIRHGMTLGELARLFNEENKIAATLTVVGMRGWRRELWFDRTGLPWINTSPNMRNMIAATLYPGIGSIEGTNISVGRGTDTPFEQIGAPWMDEVALASALNARGLPGVSFYPVSFTPSGNKYAGEVCHGVFILLLDRDAVRPVRIGVEIAAALRRLYPSQFQLDPTERLLGSRDTLQRLKAGEDPARIVVSWAPGEAAWRAQRQKYLLY
jgi:uncharacterized protein YbbC (DUF1343 family)/CubicO group peptidase (beta-lactamase class C family)